MPSFGDRERHGLVLAGCVVAAVAHQSVLWGWCIEDAAISFAYARNLALGHGLVPVPGGERIEGFSNPTWVFWLAALYRLGFTDLFAAAQWSELALGVATVPGVYLAARAGFDPGSRAPLVAAAFVAASSQHAIFGGAGLENGLFSFLMALAVWRALAELTSGGWRWSALLWFLVATTRPEGPMYAAIGGAFTAGTALVAGQGLRPALQWAGLFLGPFVAWHSWRYATFAWPFPNTYYAKIPRDDPDAWAWHGRPWSWTRSFFAATAQAQFLPVWVLGVVGDGAWRGPAAVAVSGALGVLLALAGTQRWLVLATIGALIPLFWVGVRGGSRGLAWAGLAAGLALFAASEAARSFGHVPRALAVPGWVAGSPPALLALLAITLPVLGFRGPNWPIRLLSWGLCTATIGFAVWSRGDWMEGYRWYALAVVPGALLFAAGVESVERELSPVLGPALGRWGVPALVLCALQVPPNVHHTHQVSENRNTSPETVKVRIDYVEQIRDRLHLEGPLVDLDVDQGAHLWWSDFEMVDFAGLIDVPFAHHRYGTPFVREYVFQERKPHFAHLHVHWAEQTNIVSQPEWKRDYIELPPYDDPRLGGPHRGNFVRRDLILEERWPGPGEPVGFDNGAVAWGVQVPSEPISGGAMYVEVGLSVANRRVGDFRAILFASDAEGRLASWDIAPGYDWWRPRDWPADRVFVGRFTLPMPLPPGRYDLGLVVLDADGTAAPALAADPEPRLARGELRWPGALVVLSATEGAAAAAADREQSLAAAADGRCEDAEHAWFLARKHRAGAPAEAEIAASLAGCWLLAADRSPDLGSAATCLQEARRWQVNAPGSAERAADVADRLIAEGHRARDAQDWEVAYRRFSDAVRAEPTRAWARRYAEEARAHRLR